MAGLRAPGREALATSAFFGFFFLALGVHLPFWPLWLEDWGLTPAEIGLYSGVGMGLRIVTGMLAPALADRWEARRVIAGGLCLFGAALFAAHALIESRGALFLATILTATVFSGVTPIGDALGMAAARAFRFEYAHARSVGSAAFLIANLAFGALVARYGSDMALWGTVAALAATAWFGFRHPGGGRVRAQRRPDWGEARLLAGNRTFLIFMAAIGLSQSSHAVYYAYGSVHWRALGLGEGVIGLLWAWGVAVEVVLMAAAGPWLIRRLGAAVAIGLSAAAGVARWGWMAFDPGLPALWLLQAGHALTFAAGHLGAMAFIGAAAPERLGATAQGLFGSLAGGVLTTLATFAAAAAYPALGGGAYWVAAAMSAGGLLASWALARSWSGGALRISR